MTPHRLSRRSLLAGLGLGAACVPLLNARPGRAGPPAPPKRLIVMMRPNGYHDDPGNLSGALAQGPFFSPKAGATPDAWTMPDSDQTPLKPLLPYRDKLILMGGISFLNGQASVPNNSLGGHASLPFLLTGKAGTPGPEISDGQKVTAGGPSVDVFLSKTVDANSKCPFPVLVVRPLRFTGNDQYLSFYGPTSDGAPNVPQPYDDPQQLFDQVIGQAGMTQAQLARVAAERKSVFDFTSGQLKTLSARLGSDDRQRVEAHIDAVRQVEGQLASLGSCGSSGVTRLPAAPSGTDYTTQPANKNLPAIVKADIDIIVAAMACGLTNIASLALSNSNDNCYTPFWLTDKTPAFSQPIGMADSGGFNPAGAVWHDHAIAHNEFASADNAAMKNYIDQWFLGQLAYLIEQLSTRTDPGGTAMIDNTVILFANTQRTGGGHQTDDVKWIVAGNVGGYFKPGRWLPWLGGSPNKNVSQTTVLNSIVEAMGGDYTQFGDLQFGGLASGLRG